MSHTVIHSNTNSASLAINPTDFADPTTIAVTISISALVPNLVDVFLPFTLLTSAVLYSLNLRYSTHLLLIYISYFPSLSNKTVLVFLTYLAVLRILYRPVKKQVRLRISMQR